MITYVTDFELWWLDYTKVDGNLQAQAQGKILCIKTKNKGYFSPELERYPSRQDLAIKTRDKMNIDNLTFTECSLCAPKSGSPTLCNSCLLNRDAIEKLHKEVRESNKRLLNAHQLVKNGKKMSWLKFDGFKSMMGRVKIDHDGEMWEGL